MSDTPRTDAAVEWATFRPGPITSIGNFARELERENAELRQDGICRRRGIPTKEESKRIKERDEHIERLWKENAALRANLKLLCDTIDAHDIESLSCDRDGHVYCDCLKNNAALARAAIDAARKEGTP